MWQVYTRPTSASDFFVFLIHISYKHFNVVTQPATGIFFFKKEKTETIVFSMRKDDKLLCLSTLIMEKTEDGKKLF
jgi:hypothetical protein